MTRLFPLKGLSDRELIAFLATATLLALVLLTAQVMAFSSAVDDGARMVQRLEQLQLEVDRLHLRRLGLAGAFADGADAVDAQEYRDILAQQTDALERLEAAAATPEEEAAASAATYASHTMASLEDEALSEALAGHAEAALEILGSRDYAAGRLAFGEAIARAREALWPRLEPFTARTNRAVFTTLVIAPVLGALLIGLCVTVFLRIRSFGAQLRETEARLEETEADLARRTREIQASLVARCPAPAAEFAFAPGRKLTAWLRKRGVEDLERWLKVYPGEIRKLAPHFKVLRINRAAAQLLKASEASDVRDLARWIPDRSLHVCVLAMLRALWNRSSVVSTRIDVRTFDGGERTFDVKGSLIASESGAAPTLVAALSDVTDADGARHELEALREQTDNAQRKHDELLNSVSRDLRSALDGVTGMAAALERSSLDREQREALAVIKDSGEVMRDTLDRARDFRRLEAGDIELADEPFDPAAVVHAVNTRFAPRARAKNLRLRMSIGDEARRRFAGDEGRTRQILTKLVADAIERTPRGEVEVRVTLEAGVGEDERLLTMSVHDAGPALSPAEIERALNEHAGAGLALCRRLCDAMGGGFEFSSSAENGAHAIARVRVRETGAEAAASEESEAAAPSSLGRRLSLLAVDDNAINRIVMKDMLEPLDIDLTLVDNGADAIAAWRARYFDAILLDIHMPVLSGHDVAREIRKIEAEEGRPATPIIAVSASVMKSEVEACLESGMNAHVAKPIELGKLSDAITAATSLAPPAPATDADADPDAAAA